MISIRLYCSFYFGMMVGMPLPTLSQDSSFIVFDAGLPTAKGGYETTEESLTAFNNQPEVEETILVILREEKQLDLKCPNGTVPFHWFFTEANHTDGIEHILDITAHGFKWITDMDHTYLHPERTGGLRITPTVTDEWIFACQVGNAWRFYHVKVFIEVKSKTNTETPIAHTVRVFIMVISAALIMVFIVHIAVAPKLRRSRALETVETPEITEDVTVDDLTVRVTEVTDEGTGDEANARETKETFDEKPGVSTSNMYQREVNAGNVLSPPEVVYDGIGHLPGRSRTRALEDNRLVMKGESRRKQAHAEAKSQAYSQKKITKERRKSEKLTFKSQSKKRKK